MLAIEKVPLRFYFKTFLALIKDKSYLFFQSKNGLSTLFMIESFRNFLNSTYNRDSTYIFSWSEIHLSTVLIIESFRNFANSTYNREGAYNRVTRVCIHQCRSNSFESISCQNWMSKFVDCRSTIKCSLKPKMIDFDLQLWPAIMQIWKP